MKTRMYFFVKRVSDVESIISSLEAENIYEDQIGVLSKEKNIELTELPEATLEEKSDLLNSLKRGAGTGAVTGLLAGLVVAAFPIAGIAVGGAALAGMTAGGAAFGAWSASLIGVSEQHPIVEKFEKSLEAGGFLVLADTGMDEDEATKIAESVASKNDIIDGLYGVYS